MVLSQIPNVLTVMRILLVFPFAYLLLNQSNVAALWVFFIAGVSDGVDGFLARQFQWRSRFGAIADPLADKLLLIVSYLVLAWLHIIPAWLVLLILGRDIVIVVGALLYHYRIKHLNVEPSLLGKLCTFTQIAYVILVLIDLAGYGELGLFVDYGVLLVALVTLLSGVHYIAVWALRAQQALRSRS